MNKAIKSIEATTTKILEDYNIIKAPVNVEKLAKSLGLKIIPHELGENISGALFIHNGEGIIGINENEPDVRKRFTIAHEIGHYILHRVSNSVFIDKKNVRPVYRNEESSSGEIKAEREANAFAAALLMPKNILIKEINKRDFDLASPDDNIGDLARKFNVSSQAMAFRIANLELF